MKDTAKSRERATRAIVHTSTWEKPVKHVRSPSLGISVDDPETCGRGAHLTLFGILMPNLQKLTVAAIDGLQATLNRPV